MTFGMSHFSGPFNFRYIAVSCYFHNLIWFISVKTFDFFIMSKPSTSKYVDVEIQCEICLDKSGKYTCPRCGMNICSLDCYKGPSHGQCSERFYKECVENELKLIHDDAGSKKRMEEILMRAQGSLENDEEEEDLDSDDSDDDDLASRLAGINLDDGEALWNVLTDKERSEYTQLLASSNITKILPEWSPWWIDGNNKPKLSSDIPMIASLARTEPSPMLPFLIMNTIMAYQISLRMIQGQSEVLSVEAASMIYTLSPPLCGSTNQCSSLDEAANLILTEYAKQKWGSELPRTYQNIIEDLKDLTVVASCNVLLALSHIKTIFTDAIEIIPATKNSPRFTGPPPKISHLKKIEKKLIFYLSWAKQMDDSEWDRLVGNNEIIIED